MKRNKKIRILSMAFILIFITTCFVGCGKNAENSDALTTYAKEKEETVPLTLPDDTWEIYSGEPYHIFFHSLILYPELAFDNKGHPKDGYNMWMTTKEEFKSILIKLYENNFVLYNIEEYITRNADGTVSKKDILLPPGKKPLVISIDDVNYYDYMKTDGFATRLVINDQDTVVTEVQTPTGEMIQTNDGDVMPIVDSFVKQYPDFSINGAKGIMALTGYQGAFGYRITDLTGDELERARGDVKKIADKMRKTGWQFACHSYTHNQYFQTDKITLAEMQSDTSRWKDLIEPYIGATKIYISPFGVHYKKDDPRFRYIISQGFDIFCGVGGGMNRVYNSDNMTQDRFNFDGYRMLKLPKTVEKTFFPLVGIIDKSRPAMK